MGDVREIALDTETTGLSPKDGHRVVEIGCVELINRIPTGREFHAYINPERDVPEESTAISGLTEEFLKPYPVFREVSEGFLDFIGDSQLVIHNARFDLGFLNAELGMLGGIQIVAARAVDTVLMARRKFPGSPASLDALCKRFRIDLSTREKHGAIVDARLLAAVYLELTGGRQAQLNFDEKVCLNTLEEQPLRKLRHIPVRSFDIPEQEIEAHHQQITGLKNALWRVG